MNRNVAHRGDALLKKWLEGTITWQEERELEQLAQGDAMLADALAGFRALPEAKHTQAVERLKGRLQERKERKRRGLIFYLPRVAAAAAMVGALSFGIWFLNKEESQSQAVTQAQQEETLSTEEQAELLTEDVQAIDTNAALAIEERATTPVNPGQEDSPIIKPTVPRTDGVVVELETDTNIAIADAALPTQTEETKPDLAAKKAEAAPIVVPQAFEPAASQARARTLSPSNPNNRVVSGKVTDASGEPLIGASIVIAGTNQGTVSDIEGRFKIELPKNKDLLMISYTGYDSKEVRLGPSDTVNLQLSAGGMALEEVVVSGLGETSVRKETEKKDTPQVRIRSELSISRQPEPRGGFEQFKNYIDKNLRYPKAAQEAGIEGEVAIAFLILPNGKLTDFKIVKSLGYGLDEEAIRLLREGPRWEITDKLKAKEIGGYTVEFKLKK